MANWEQFEIECTDYLNDEYGNYATFIHQGGSNSNIPDILVETNSGDSFYIEVKHSPAQSGQFVLLPDIELQEFVYSNRNSSRVNSYAEAIIAYMNDDFDAFANAGTKGKNIDMNEDIFADWIIDHYSDIGVEFIISNNHVIIPISELSNYFDISACYRIKRSGSSSVGRPRLNEVSAYLNDCDYSIENIKPEGDKLYVYSSSDLDKVRFKINKNEYMFSQKEAYYEIRKLSNTYNANVIFSIILDISPEKAALLRKLFEDRLK